MREARRQPLARKGCCHSGLGSPIRKTTVGNVMGSGDDAPEHPWEVDDSVRGREGRELTLLSRNAMPNRTDGLLCAHLAKTRLSLELSVTTDMGGFAICS